MSCTEWCIEEDTLTLASALGGFRISLVVYVMETRILQPDTSDLISSEKLPLAGMCLIWLLETAECGWITVMKGDLL